jgi:hypothetical protein
MWTHRHGSGATATYACYEQIWTGPDLPVAAAHAGSEHQHRHEEPETEPRTPHAPYLPDR